MVLPSAEMPPFCVDGTSAASSPAGAPGGVSEEQAAQDELGAADDVAALAGHQRIHDRDLLPFADRDGLAAGLGGGGGRRRARPRQQATPRRQGKPQAMLQQRAMRQWQAPRRARWSAWRPARRLPPPGPAAAGEHASSKPNARIPTLAPKRCPTPPQPRSFRATTSSTIGTAGRLLPRQSMISPSVQYPRTLSIWLRSGSWAR